MLQDGSVAAHGFAALADLDSNGDGVINHLDAEFYNLKVWVDKNSDGITDEGELKSLADLGIIQLNLVHENTNQILNGDNQLSHIGSYVKADGSIHAMGNVDFKMNDIYAQYVDKIELTLEEEGMSGISGLGRVRDLAEAITLSDNLKDILSAYSILATKSEQTLLAA